MEVAKDFPEYTFAIADEEDYADELKSLGLSESGEEVNVGILGEGGKKYAMQPEEFDSDVLRDFVLAFKKGEELLISLPSRHIILVGSSIQASRTQQYCGGSVLSFGEHLGYSQVFLHGDLNTVLNEFFLI